MDLPLSDELFARFRDLLLARAGLNYPDQRRPDLAHALSQAARACNMSDLGRLYTGMLASDLIWDQAIAQLTIGETYFFRNGAQFAALREHILPDLLVRRSGVRNLRLWSAGCATGEEPYSLAMALSEALPADWQVGILATDINPQFIERAREAVYGNWSFRETPEDARARFFTPDGPRWRLRPELRRQVVFARLNLAEPSYPAVINGTVALDIIFCRNVTIYFDEATTRAVAARFYAALAPGGWLVVGHAEPNTGTYRGFETVNLPGTVLYRKPLSAPAFVTVAPGMPPVALPPPQPAAARQPHPTVDRPPHPEAASLPELAPEPVPPDPLALAWAAAGRGDWEAARSYADVALRAQPMRAEAHYLSGQIHEHAGEFDAGLQAYRRSVYLNPGCVMGTVGMANIWRQTSQRAEARRSYQSALRLLQRLTPDAVIPDSEGASAAEISAFVQAQLALLS
jgi:chemotaxis protein methyltransferase CheR